MIPTSQPEVNWYPVIAPLSPDPDTWHVAAYSAEHAQELYDKRAAEGFTEYGAPASFAQDWSDWERQNNG